MAKVPDYQIRAATVEFRSLIERWIEGCPASSLPPSFRYFPRGSCGDATPLLGTYLIDRELGEFQYVLGKKYPSNKLQSHAWLQRDSLIVDITADQFDEVTQKVVVSRRSQWHRSFWQEVSHEVADFREFDGYALRVLQIAYDAILECA